MHESNYSFNIIMKHTLGTSFLKKGGPSLSEFVCKRRNSLTLDEVEEGNATSACQKLTSGRSAGPFR